MLTSQAWNAFLKTLEEPPPGTIFVLATTEAQKVLPTVVDRCHRFDFGRPTVEQLASVLQRVAGQEGIEIAPDALALLARHATGSFRDALGTLEQLVTYSGTTITVGDVQAVLGAVDDDLLFGTLDAVATHDAGVALRAAAALAATGRDLVAGMRDIEAHTRELLVVRTLGGVPAELRVTPERDARLSDQAQRVAATDLVRLLELLGTAMRAVKDGADPRTRLELVARAGGDARGRRLDEGAAGPDRPARGGAPGRRGACAGDAADRRSRRPARGAHADPVGSARPAARAGAAVRRRRGSGPGGRGSGRAPAGRAASGSGGDADRHHARRGPRGVARGARDRRRRLRAAGRGAAQRAAGRRSPTAP